ncbi:MAG: fatty acid desaturase [Myxococcota bacterium]|nr:fatty acid desaturase [Myxococcota bacterium]
MPFLSRVLEPPSYGFVRGGSFYLPTSGQIWREFLARSNVLRSRKQWLPLWSWLSSLALVPFLLVFLTKHFHVWLLVAGFFYSMVVLGTHGTVYLHRYCTHRAFAFKSAAWRFVFGHLVIKIVSEELYVVSHHVHHRMSERAGDPYNAHGGWLYCFLADVNHQPISQNLSEQDYRRVRLLLRHTGLRMNSYEEYTRWGSVSHPAHVIGTQLLNWAFWYGVLFALGGHALATAIFGAACVWAFGIRTFNFDGHGRGKDSRREGYDFHRTDLSINQWFPGFVSGEWHNNHHLYPSSARAGFLPHQVDLAWCAIRTCAWLGGVDRWRDSKADFLRDHYRPYLAAHPVCTHRPTET